MPDGSAMSTIAFSSKAIGAQICAQWERRPRGVPSSDRWPDARRSSNVVAGSRTWVVTATEQLGIQQFRYRDSNPDPEGPSASRMKRRPPRSRIPGSGPGRAPLSAPQFPDAGDFSSWTNMCAVAEQIDANQQNAALDGGSINMPQSGAVDSVLGS
jgi:hypothetical protein